MQYKLVATLAAVAMLATGGNAQNVAPQPAPHSPSNAVLKDPRARATDVPARGANSFTQAQAKRRIDKAGYGHVSDLRKDQNGLWQGSAMNLHRKVHVAVDYKGDVTAR